MNDLVKLGRPKNFNDKLGVRMPNIRDRKLLSKKINDRELTRLSKNIRKNILHMVHSTRSSHVGSAFSIVEILIVLYKLVMKHDKKNHKDPDRDRLVLSKGHACAAMYAILAELGYFNKKLLKEYSKNGSIMMYHINSEVPGVEFSNGSLGHGLPVALGMAIAAKNLKKKWRVFVVISVGELNQGSNWEAFSLAGHLKIDNLYAIVDSNKLQATGFTKEIIDLEPLSNKFKSFGWEVLRVNGHNFQNIYNKIKKLINSKNRKPKILIADTVKGKGVSFMENELSWHYRYPSEEEFNLCLKEI